MCSRVRTRSPNVWWRRGAGRGGPTRGDDPAEAVVSLASRFRTALAMFREPLGFTMWGAINLLQPARGQALAALGEVVAFRPDRPGR